MRFRRTAPQEPTSAADTLRPFVFGDVPLGAWPPPGEETEAEPWRSFVAAREAKADGRTDEAITIWTRIANDSSLEARQVLQAWSFLRAHGVAPPEADSGRVLGVVCEVAVGKQHDLLAAYSDGSSRYLNHSGKVVVAEGGPQGAVEAAKALIETAEPLGKVIGLWDQPALPPLSPGDGRVLLLTPGGFRFGQGPQDALMEDPAASAVLDAATRLMLVLTGAVG